MGMYPGAALIWGIQISAYDDEGEPTCWWNADEEDWVDLAALQLASEGVSNPSDEVPPAIWNGYDDAAFKAWKSEHPGWEKRMQEYRKAKVEANVRVEIVTYGHYDDDEHRAILTPSALERYTADAWSPARISDLPNPEMDRDKALSKGTDTLRSLGFDESFYGGDPAWWLVASYG